MKGRKRLSLFSLNRISSRKKRGSTLVELSVALALIAILVTMVTTFSVMMHKLSSNAQKEYSFIEDSASLSLEARKWISLYDCEGNSFSLSDGKLTVTDSLGELIAVSDFTNDFSSIEEISFSLCDSIIKCNTRNGLDEACIERSFVFFVRCASVSLEEVSALD